MKESIANPSVKKRKYSTRRRRKNVTLTALCMPAILHSLVFCYIPMIGIVIAFQFYKPLYRFINSPFVGFDNFLFLFKSITFTRIVTNAIVLNLLNTLFGTIFSIFIGVLLFEVNKRFLKVSQIIMFFPYFIAWPIVGVVLDTLIGNKSVMSGILSNVLGYTYNLYEHPEPWWAILTVVRIWKGTGVAAVIYYAVLLGTDKGIYESASIDGASRFRRIWHISFPMLMPMVVIQTILGCSNILRSDFGLIFFVTQNNPVLYPRTDVIETYMYRALRVDGDYSISAATGLAQGVVGLVLMLIMNAISRRVSKQISLF